MLGQPLDEAEPAMAERDQMVGDREAGGLVVHADPRHAAILVRGGRDAHDARTRAAQSGDQPHPVGKGRGQDDAGTATVLDQFDQSRLDVVACLLQRVGRQFHPGLHADAQRADFEGGLVIGVRLALGIRREDQQHRPVAAAREVAGLQIDLIAKRRDRFQHPGPRSIADIGAVVQHPRHGRAGHAGQARDVVDRWPACRHLLPRFPAHGARAVWQRRARRASDRLVMSRRGRRRSSAARSPRRPAGAGDCLSRHSAAGCHDTAPHDWAAR